MAIPMPIVQDIRRLDRQGMSRAQIARRLHVDRGTVAIVTRIWRIARPSRRRIAGTGRRSTRTAHLVDEWLEADRMLPRKQRHTDQARARPSAWRRRTTTASIRPTHALRAPVARGEPRRAGSRGVSCELKWAAGEACRSISAWPGPRIAGEMGRTCIAWWSRCRIRTCGCAWRCPGENAECLCHGLMLVFEHIRGVPPVIADA